MKTRKPGRVVGKITYRSTARTIDFELRLVKHPVSDGLFYQVQHFEDALRIDLKDENPETLRKLVLESAEKQLTIEWKRVIVLHVDDRFLGDDRHTQLCKGALQFSAELWEFGTVKDGSQVSRSIWKDGSAHGSTQRGWPFALGKLQKENDHHFESVHTSSSYVEDTPDNRARIESIAKGLTTLSNQMTKLIRPDHILKTLANVRTLGLPAPKEKKPKEDMVFTCSADVKDPNGVISGCLNRARPGSNYCHVHKGKA